MEQTLQQPTKPQTTQQPIQKLPSTIVFVFDIRTLQSKTNKPYQRVTDQDGNYWFLFNNEKVTLNHGYMFTWEQQEKNYKKIISITECTNVWKQEALKEVANKNNIIENLCKCVSYANGLAMNGVLDVAKVEEKALEFYNFIKTKSDEFYNATQQKQ